MFQIMGELPASLQNVSKDSRYTGTFANVSQIHDASGAQEIHSFPFSPLAKEKKEEEGGGSWLNGDFFLFLLSPPRATERRKGEIEKMS